MNLLAVVLVVLASLALNAEETDAQEKKNVRVVFVSQYLDEFAAVSHR